jgi:hypothetical protein
LTDIATLFPVEQNDSDKMEKLFLQTVLLLIESWGQLTRSDSIKGEDLSGERSNGRKYNFSNQPFYNNT